MQGALTNWIREIGRRVLTFIVDLGGLANLMGRVLRESGGLFRDRGLFIQEAIVLGIGSLPLVLVVGSFTGAVTAWQGHYQFEGYLPFDLIGPGIFKSLMLELGPVLTALIIAGRVSASIAAEIGTMNVTEQIDALETMSISSVRFLAVPRIAAMTFMMPLLVIQAVFFGMLGGSVVLTVFMNLTSHQFWGLIPNFFKVYDVFSGMLKAVIFGFTTSVIGCFIGFRTSGGAEGVGFATIAAFVWSCIAILILDFFIATIMF